MPSGGSAFVVSGVVDSPLTMVIDADRPVYAAGATALITVGLAVDDTGVEGATPTGTVTEPLAGDQPLAFTEQGNGVYVASYLTPAVGGRLPVRVDASGIYDGKRYSRVALAELYVKPAAVGLTGFFADGVRDENGDGLYEAIDVTVGITGTAPGPHLVSADLYDDTGEFVAHTALWVDLASGGQQIELTFDGDAIRSSGRDGPYVLRNLTVSEDQDGATPVLVSSSDLWTTGDHDAADFASTCFILEVASSPAAGGSVEISPGAACNGGRQHPAGTQVMLTANPAAGFVFAGWSGDLSGGGPTQVIKIEHDMTVIAEFTLVATLTPRPSSTPPPSATPLPSLTPASTATPTPGAPVPTDTSAPPPTSTREATPTPRPLGPLFLPITSRS